MAFDSFLPPVVVMLLADSKEFDASIDNAGAKLEGLGAAADTSGGGFSSFASKASTAIIGIGAAVVGVSADFAMKYQAALDHVQNTTNVTASMLKHIGTVSLQLSDETGQSAEDIVAAYGAVEAAGYSRARADAAVAAAAKLTLIAGGNVTQNTQSLIAAQNLGITKGMSAAKVADLLTIALKGNEAGLSGVVALLSGKVGSSFAAYKQSAGEAVAIANEFSLAGITQTRQIATFVNKLGTLEGPMTTIAERNGKLTTSSASYVNSLESVGLNVNKTRDAFTGPDGLINGLKYLKATADGSLPQLQRYLTAIFGATGVGAGMALINNINTISSTIDKANNASGKGLNTAASIAAGQFDNQMHIIEQRLKNGAISFGLKVLPYLHEGANDIIGAMNYLDKHPDAMKALMVTAGTLFATAVGYKLYGVVSSIWGSINAKAQTGFLAQIAANTAATAAEGGATAGVGGAEVAGGALGTFGRYVGVFGAGVIAFEAASKFLSTKEGKKVGNFIVDNNVLGLGTIANVTADLLHKRVYGDLQAGNTNPEEKYLKSIGEWGNYQKLMLADATANYAMVKTLSDKINAREHRGQVYGPTRPGGTSTWHVKVTR